jgi:phospholipase C
MQVRKHAAGRKLRQRIGAATAALGLFTTNAAAVDQAQTPEHVRTTTPIKHVIVVLAENSSFDHAFGTYRPRNGQSIGNLLSRGLVNEDGTPGPNFRRATQFTVAPQPLYYISAPYIGKTAFAMLPPPDLNGVRRQSSAICHRGCGARRRAEPRSF